MLKHQTILFYSLILLWSSCHTYQAKTYDFPKPVDTQTKPIQLQKKKKYSIKMHQVYADNRFDAARLNDFIHLNQDTFQAVIAPENSPINHSAYYALRLWSDAPKSITLKLHYNYAKHRYPPKISKDGLHWTKLEAQKVTLSQDSIHAFLNLDLSKDTLWVAAQELQTSKQVMAWCEGQQKQPNVHLNIYGKSKLKRDLPVLQIVEGDAKKKGIIVILSRQHPPEVTGYFAMQAFVEEILADNLLSKTFRKKYNVLVFPLLNPDGVDLGHWRFNAGGIDLNRDWAYYHQPETKQVADYVTKIANINKSKVLLGLDFHSTWYDIFYTNRTPAKNLPHFKDYWIDGIESTLDDLKLVERPSNVGRPVSKSWFLTQFGAEGVTFEIGDDTPRDLIQTKGKVAAKEMMQLLIYKD
jgi:hypothetical protein